MFGVFFPFPTQNRGDLDVWRSFQTYETGIYILLSHIHLRKDTNDGAMLLHLQCSVLG